MNDTALPTFGKDDDRAPGVDATFATAHRVQLDAHSWVEHVPEWLDSHDVLFHELLDGADWQQRWRRMYDKRVREPRLTAEHHDLALAPEMLQHMARSLTTHYGVAYDRLGINLYRTHRDSTGWHGDGASTRRRECVVPVLSLGTPRRFLVRPTQGGSSTTFRPLAGDLIVMGGRCQVDWRHSVPKEVGPSGPRISVNFAAPSQYRPD